jgi:hypothetical protein
MRLHWRLVLPVVGLMLFTSETYHSVVRLNRETHQSPHRYFWWSSIRLDSDPLKPRTSIAPSCAAETTNCTTWDLQQVWITPGLLARSLMISALPAFLAGAFLVSAGAHFGVSEVSSFMISMPLLIFTWYYFIGWLVDRWRRKWAQPLQGVGAR